jgi:hypothetical protein
MTAFVNTFLTEGISEIGKNYAALVAGVFATDGVIRDRS